MCYFFLRWRESSTSSKECHCRGEIRFICYLLAFDASPWFGKAFRTSFPLDKICHILALWQTQFLSKSCEEVIPNSTCPSPSSTDWMFHIALGEFKSGDGCSCDLKLLYHRGWWYNHSSKDRFLNLSVSIILGFASPKNPAGCAGCHWPTTPSSGIVCSCSAYWGSLLSLLLHMMLCFDFIL